jgi:hypothetical protein
LTEERHQRWHQQRSHDARVDQDTDARPHGQLPRKTTFTGTADGTTIKGAAVVVQADGVNAGGPLTLTKQ